MNFRICLLFCVTWVLDGIVAPPVTQSTISPNDVNSNNNKPEAVCFCNISWILHSYIKLFLSFLLFNLQDEFDIEYDRYLKEVVQALESDPQFRDKLQNAEDADIRVR